jgi:hypothetical protein
MQQLEIFKFEILIFFLIQPSSNIEPPFYTKHTPIFSFIEIEGFLRSRKH